MWRNSTFETGNVPEANRFENGRGETGLNAISCNSEPVFDIFTISDHGVTHSLYHVSATSSG